LTIRVSADGTIVLDGVCPIEDAETLQQHLLTSPHAVVDWRSCAGTHTAVIQVLLAAKADVRGPAGSEFLRTHVEPFMNRRMAA
jgi:hypothetical protein